MMDGRASVAVMELRSEVVLWLTARAKNDCVVDPREKHRSIVEGRPPFLGWWVGIAVSLWRKKLLSSRQFAIL